MKIPRWAQVVIGLGILLVFLGIGAIIAVSAWFQQNVNVAVSSDQDAEVEFDRVRKQFAGRPALLELKDGVPRYTSGARPAATAPTQKLNTLHVLAWDPDDEELARFSLPFWLLRLKSEPIRIGSYASGMDDGGVDLRPEDVEKFGPGIILDTTTPNRERVLVWAQ